MDNYGIKPGYEARSEAPTFVGDINDYWNSARQQTANTFQWPVYAAAADFLQSSHGGSFIDVGCGYPAKIGALIKPVTGDIHLIDQPSMAPLVARDFPDYQFTGVDLEEDNGHVDLSGDCVVCADVIEHLLNPMPLIALLRQLLNPGGRLFLSTPERDHVRGKHCNQSPNPEHVREWNQQEFAALLHDSGLRIIEHRCLPQRRHSPILPTRALGLLRPAEFLGCQLAICEHA
ncbi:MAG: class I SAM-dependent methyltransferase [Pseudomonadaceae bacterium]|nr:class I SAM-dependent methyltransferase [Pseudomonadaceae bacterium]